jgi:hypothetical protein
MLKKILFTFILSTGFTACGESFDKDVLRGEWVAQTSEYNTTQSPSMKIVYTRKWFLILWIVK